jgi:hypothetical protein
MALAVTHVLIAVILASIYRDHIAKHTFSHFYILLAAFAGLLPDLDYPAKLLLPQYFWHGQFHIIYVPVLFLIATILLYAFKTHRKYYLSAGILTFGYLLHFMLDCAGGGYEYLQPISVMNYCPLLITARYWPAIDASLLMLWLVYEYYGHHIKQFF